MAFIGEYEPGKWYIVEEDAETSKTARYGPFASRKEAEAQAFEWNLEVA